MPTEMWLHFVKHKCTEKQMFVFNESRSEFRAAPIWRSRRWAREKTSWIMQRVTRCKCYFIIKRDIWNVAASSNMTLTGPRVIILTRLRLLALHKSSISTVRVTDEPTTTNLSDLWKWIRAAVWNLHVMTSLLAVIVSKRIIPLIYEY